MQRKHLILFTAEFPFGTSEPFLETEIVFLAKSFDKVTIVSRNTQSKECREVPSNCEIIREELRVGSLQKLLGLRHYFSREVRDECNYTKKCLHQKFNWIKSKTVIVAYAQGRKIAALAKSIHLDNPNYSNFFYSYWSDDCAIGLALFRSKTRDVKCFTRAHGWDVYFEVSAIHYLPFRNLLGSELDAIFTISKRGFDYCKSEWKVSKDGVLRISRLGVQKQAFQEIGNEPFTIVSCANMIPLKRIDLLIDALSLLKLSQTIRWVHFGKGPLEESLRNQAAEKLGNGVDVQFFGQVSNSELIQWYSENRPALFVNTSESEGIPVSIMEAMSFGTPVVATNVGGTSEIVNNENGLLLDQNPDAIAVKEAIQMFIEMNRDRNKAYRQAAFTTCEESFNSTKNYAQFIQEIQLLK